MFYRRARLVRKAVSTGALSVEEGKAKLHEELDDIIDAHLIQLQDKMQRSAELSAKRDLDLGDNE